jgi:hypothetical protein
MAVYSIRERLLRQKPTLIRQMTLEEAYKRVVSRNSAELRKIPHLAHHQMFDSNINTTVTMTTMTTLMYPLLQDPQARCNVPLLHVYVQVYNLVWACLYLKFYLEIKSTLVILWFIFIPLKINNAMNNIYQLVMISYAILSLSSWPLIPLTTIPNSEKNPISETCLVPRVSDKRLCTV